MLAHYQILHARMVECFVSQACKQDMACSEAISFHRSDLQMAHAYLRSSCDCFSVDGVVYNTEPISAAHTCKTYPGI